MTALYGDIKGELGETIGLATISSIRADPSPLRYQNDADTRCVLVLSHLGNYLEDPHPVFSGLHATRVQGNGQTFYINPLMLFRDASGAESVVAGFIDVEFAGLGGDLIGANGVWRLYLDQVENEPYDFIYKGYNGLIPGLGLSTPRVRYIASRGRWELYLAKAGSCWKSWFRSADNDDPEGLYSELDCEAAECSDPDTCSSSTSGTCRVRWGGATWL